MNVLGAFQAATAALVALLLFAEALGIRQPDLPLVVWVGLLWLHRAVDRWLDL